MCTFIYDLHIGYMILHSKKTKRLQEADISEMLHIPLNMQSVF